MGFLEGTIRQYLFFNEESSYSVIKVEIRDTSESDLLHFEPTIVVCGFFPRLELNQVYRFHGDVAKHPKYGVQYNAARFERIMDSSKTGVVDYLQSDLFKGIGPKTAKAIVETLGVDCLEMIANNPDVLDSIPRMNKTKKTMIAKTILDNRQMESTLVWLYGFEISPRMAMKIYQRYGFAAVDVIRNNPYLLIDEVEGIGFKRADEIGLKIGFTYDHPLRIKAVIMYLLQEYISKYGDTYLEKASLLEYSQTYLNSSSQSNVDQQQISDMLVELVKSGKIVESDGKIGLHSLYLAEKSIAECIRKHSELVYETPELSVIEEYIMQFEKARKITYTDMQKKAIVRALSEHFVIITGGPGTGKTTIIDAIAHIYNSLRENSADVRLAAPTGKAAKRLQEATGLEATTVHRLLGYDYEGRFAFGRDLKLSTDLVIIDETSMLDSLVASQLFQALPDKAKLVLVGDDNQLPSVGPGQVLADMIESDLFTVVKLEKIHRQAYDSSIVELAYDVLNQNIDDYTFRQQSDRRFIVARENAVTSVVMATIREFMQKGYTLTEDIQVLAPVYKGINGIDSLNQLIQERFNKNHDGYEIRHNDRIFRYNDKVMQLINQPEDGIMNGDLGIVTGIVEDKELLVDFSGKTVKYNVKDFDNLTLAYAISIHKSQGSEFKVVIMPLVLSYSIMLKRRLIYTGITRAKEMLVLIGDRFALKRGVYSKDLPRKTWLREFLNLEESEEEAKELTIEDFL